MTSAKIRIPPAWLYLLIFALTLVAYLPALHADFIWDDSGHITRPDLQSLHGLYRIWFEPGATQQYYPFLHSAFWVEHGIFGDSAAGYHWLNVLLHATAACLVCAVLRRLDLPGAGLAGLLFAVHPVGVESVAWIAEQKNTLSTVLYLLAALAYLGPDRPTRRRYGLASFLFVCAVLTKTVTASLPAALLVVTWWRRGRLSWREDVAPLLPWFVISLIAGYATSVVEHDLIGAQGVDFAFGPLTRVLLAGRVVWFYAAKLVFPANLMFIYPRWDVAAAGMGWLALLAGLVAVLGALLWRARTQRGPLAALLFFAGTLFPALGFINVYPFVFSFVADHFQYLACLGLLAPAACAGAALGQRLPRAGAIGLAGAVVAALGLLTWQQCEMYRDVFALYETTLAKNPRAWMAHNNLAIALTDSGRAAEAVPHYEQALVIRPNYPEAENNLGFALVQLGRPADAVPHYQRALTLQPQYPEALNNLAIALMSLGRTAEAEAAFASAIRLRPGYLDAQLNLGLAYARAGEPEQAIPQFAAAARAHPESELAELDWAAALADVGRVAEAAPHFTRALALKPDWPNGLTAYGRALARGGQLDEAIAQFRHAIAIDPQFGDAHFNLAIALRQVGRLAEAESEYEQAQRLGAAPR